MNDAVELAINITSHAVDAGFDAMIDSAREMERAVDTATSGAANAASRLDAVSGSAETLDSKSAAATGALGALSSGFELIGAEGAAAGLQSAALAADFFSGVGQALNLVLGLESLAHIKATVTTAAHTAATTAGGAAAKAAAAGQWVLNAALSANPIGLVIIAVIALVAVFVLLYKRSETVREIVGGAMKIIKAAVDAVIGSVSSLAGWITDRLAPGFQILRQGATAAIDLIKSKFGPLAETAQEVFDKAKNFIGDTIDSALDKVEYLKDQAGIFFGQMLAPIHAIRDAVQAIIDKIAAIKLPKIDLNPLNNSRTSSFAAPVSGAPPVTININVDGSGIVDPNALGATLATLVADNLTRLGHQVVTG